MMWGDSGCDRVQMKSLHGYIQQCCLQNKLGQQLTFPVAITQYAFAHTTLRSDFQMSPACAPLLLADHGVSSQSGNTLSQC